MTTKRKTIYVVLGLALLGVLAVAALRQNDYMLFQDISTVDVISDGRDIYLTITDVEYMHRATLFTRLKSAVVEWPISDEVLIRTSLSVVEIRADSASKYEFSEFYAPVALVPIDGALYMYDRGPDLSSETPLEWYRFDAGEFTPIPEQKARALEGRLTRPFWEHWKAQGWESFTELDIRPRDDTPRVIDLKLNGLPMTLTFALLRKIPFGSDNETVVRLTVECDGERILSEDIVWNHRSMDVTKQDWIDFKRSPAVRTRGASK